MSKWRAFLDMVGSHVGPVAEKVFLGGSEALSKIPLAKRVLVPGVAGSAFGAFSGETPEESKGKALVYGLLGGALGGFSPSILKGVYDFGRTAGYFLKDPLEALQMGWVTSSPVAHKGALPKLMNTPLESFAAEARRETGKTLAQQLRHALQAGKGVEGFEEAAWHLLDTKGAARNAILAARGKLLPEVEKLRGIEAALKNAATLKERRLIRKALKEQKNVIKEVEERIGSELFAPNLRSIGGVTESEILRRGKIPAWAGELSRLGWTGMGPITKYLPVGKKSLALQFLLMGPVPDAVKMIKGEEAPSNFLSSAVSTAYLQSAFLPGVGILGPLVGSTILGGVAGRLASPLDALWRKPGAGNLEKVLKETGADPIDIALARNSAGRYKGHFIARYYKAMAVHLRYLADRARKKGDIREAKRLEAMAERVKKKSERVALASQIASSAPSISSPAPISKAVEESSGLQTIAPPKSSLTFVPAPKADIDADGFVDFN